MTIMINMLKQTCNFNNKNTTLFVCVVLLLIVILVFYIIIYSLISSIILEAYEWSDFLHNEDHHRLGAIQDKVNALF